MSVLQGSNLRVVTKLVNSCDFFMSGNNLLCVFCSPKQPAPCSPQWSEQGAGLRIVFIAADSADSHQSG